MSLPNMKKPCGNCPFRKDSKQGWLGSKRMRDILGSSSFVCHKDHTRQCAGHMLVRGLGNQYVRAARIMGIPLELKGDDLVFETEEQCIEHHAARATEDPSG